jgi:hypothetical protein
MYINLACIVVIALKCVVRFQTMHEFHVKQNDTVLLETHVSVLQFPRVNRPVLCSFPVPYMFQISMSKRHVTHVFRSEFEVLSAATLKIAFLWDMTPSYLVGTY